MMQFFRLLPLGLVLVLVGYAGLITIRAQDLADQNKSLTEDIKNIRAAMALTEQLRKANAILDKDQDDIRNDLRDAQGYSDLLSADVVRSLERLRAGSPAP
jgi:uncharacterized membrane protein